MLAGPFIAVDWGTTNRRAYRLDVTGRVEAEFEDDLGIKSFTGGQFEAAAADIRDRLRDLPMLLIGMAGSDRGWRDVPYLPLPAGLGDLARALCWVEPGRTAIVPGLCVTGDRPDVMRGEEVQLLAGLTPPDALVCHPGTHCKWGRLEGGRIVEFRTMMTGELFALLRDHSILDLEGDVTVDDAFRAGVREGLGGRVVGPLFGVRAATAQKRPLDNAADFASGVLIGNDLREALPAGDVTVHVVGRPELTALYAAALHEAGRHAVEIDGARALLAGARAIMETVR